MLSFLGSSDYQYCSNVAKSMLVDNLLESNSSVHCCSMSSIITSTPIKQAVLFSVSNKYCNYDILNTSISDCITVSVQNIELSGF